MFWVTEALLACAWREPCRGSFGERYRPAHKATSLVLGLIIDRLGRALLSDTRFRSGPE